MRQRVASWSMLIEVCRASEEASKKPHLRKDGLKKGRANGPAFFFVKRLPAPCVCYGAECRTNSLRGGPRHEVSIHGVICRCFPCMRGLGTESCRDTKFRHSARHRRRGSRKFRSDAKPGNR